MDSSQPEMGKQRAEEAGERQDQARGLLVEFKVTTGLELSPRFV